MKNVRFFLLLTAVSVFFFWPSRALAGGPSAYNISLTPSASTASADGDATITIAVYAYEYRCSLTSGGVSYYYLNPDDCAANGYGAAIEEPVYPAVSAGTKIGASGDGNTLSASSVSQDSSGHASFTIKCAVAGTKSIPATYNRESTPATTIQVTFTAPTSTVTTPTPAPTKSQPKPTPTTPTPAATPAAPQLAEIKVGDSVTTASKPQIDGSQPLILSGKTVPNGKVTLVIHSTPRTVSVVADKDGNWSYSVSGLEPGNHYVEATVTDPTTNTTSEAAKLLDFTVTAANTAI